MAKRRAEDTLLHDSPSKRCYRSLCSVELQLDSMHSPGGVSLSPPSLLALLGTRCRKRPHYFEDPDQKQEEEAAATGLYRKTTHCDTRKHAVNVLTTQTSGSFQDRRSSGSLTSRKKRPREDCTSSETVNPTSDDKSADAETNTEDCAYNSFQFWRVPLPELDLSLLEDVTSRPHSSSDTMET